MLVSSVQLWLRLRQITQTMTKMAKVVKTMPTARSTSESEGLAMSYRKQSGNDFAKTCNSSRKKCPLTLITFMTGIRLGPAGGCQDTPTVGWRGTLPISHSARRHFGASSATFCHFNHYSSRVNTQQNALIRKRDAISIFRYSICNQFYSISQ